MKIIETLNPASLKSALQAKNGKNTVAVAGGTDILVRLHDVLNKPWPKLLILEKVSSLHRISLSKNAVSIGPLVTFAEIEKSAILKKHAPQLVEAASLAGSVQIRNRATIGGNIANGSPAGDLIPPLYVLGAKLELSSIRGKRMVPIEEFYRGPGLTVLKSNELITSIKLTKIINHGFFLRLATRKALAISKVSVASSATIKKGKVAEIKIALGAVAPTVIRATATEEFLKR